MRNFHRLIISFIGGADLRHIESDDENMSPVVRMIVHLSSLQPRVAPARTRLVIFNDDKPGATERAKFVGDLRDSQAGLGLADMAIDAVKIDLPRGPTDLNALYELVGLAMRDLNATSYPEVLIHLSSGTPAMQSTLIVAANCIPFKKVRLFETSNKEGKSVQELRLPYVLAARANRLTNHGAGRAQLPGKARRQLLQYTVINDRRVEMTYQALYKLAKATSAPPRAILCGTTGSGKWHACRQFGHWRGEIEVVIRDQESVPTVDALPENATVLLHRLDRWHGGSLHWLSQLAAQRPDTAIAATFRTDRPPLSSMDSVMSEGLRGAAIVDLPHPGVRTDIVELGKAIASKHDIHHGKLEARLSHDWMTDIYPRGLHDLETLVTSGALLSGGAHPDRPSYRRVADGLVARGILDEAWQVISGQQFGCGLPNLKEVLEDIQKAAILLARAEGRSQTSLTAMTGVSQSEVSRIEKRHFHLGHSPE